MLLLAVVLASNAPLPIAVFCLPVVFDLKALLPIAVLRIPPVFASKALEPIAVFNSPEEFFRAWYPTAVLSPYMPKEFNASIPIPVLFVAVSVVFPVPVPIKKFVVPFPLSIRLLIQFPKAEFPLET